MATRTARSDSLLETMNRYRADLLAVLARYGASNPRLFGSVARGDATAASDVDLMVDLDSTDGNSLLRVAGISEELSTLLGVRVDVVTDELLRQPVSVTAHSDAVPL